MSLDKICFSHSHMIDLSQYQKRGTKSLEHSITTLPTSEGFITIKYSIYAWSKNTRTLIHTYTLSSNFQTLEYVCRTLDTLIDDYTNNGSTDGNMVIQTCNRLEAQEAQYLHTSSNTYSKM